MVKVTVVVVVVAVAWRKSLIARERIFSCKASVFQCVLMLLPSNVALEGRTSETSLSSSLVTLTTPVFHLVSLPVDRIEIDA